MPKRWYIHKFYRGVYQGCYRGGEKVSFDDVDRTVAVLSRKYGPAGWTYEITDTSKKPCPGFVEQGAGI